MTPLNACADRLRTLTFDDLLGAGVVHLLLGGVGGKHVVEHIRLSLHTQKPAESRRADMKENETSLFGLTSQTDTVSFQLYTRHL